ncbi:MAG TPA: permease [Acidimicrobiales bacterium]|nr:permease [Acidimicrobiales bacterium]
MTAVTVATIAVDLGRGLREGLFMFWETLWALTLGFLLSGAVQAFVSKDQMRRRLGGHSPANVARASGYGMVSSSCSYAASAMTKSLITKGADFTSAMVFMFASTNLVVELGVVMLVLLGWQFMVAEFIGGPIMIVLLALLGSAAFTSTMVAAARRRAQSQSAAAHERVTEGRSSPVSSDEREEHSPPTCAEHAEGADDVGGDLPVSSPRTLAGWSDAASYALADATMLRKELAIGYVVAGLLAVLVPHDVWNALFLSGHGFWSSLENAFVGPLIAVVSWVCSIGNVPLAAALWSGGISFGGVIAFIFADLISMPLLVIYRKFYGTRVMVRMLLVFYAVMAVAGLLTEGVFAALHLTPARRVFALKSAHFSWDYTTYLDLVFLVVALGAWWLVRRRARLGGGVGYAIDPVCAMQVRTADAPATSRHAGATYNFCSDKCRERFDADPERFGGRGPLPPAGGTVVDPVCGMSVEPASAAARRTHQGTDYWFCSPGCAERFDTDPERFSRPGGDYEPMAQPVTLTLAPPARRATSVDPVCGMSVEPASAAARRTHQGTDYWFCSPGCAERFDAEHPPAG